ncbi:MAG: hypothetical protein KY469_08670 [Actinobacteria bacterium]|nr:hypothetical protein [Actinomycetota bacterium]
MTARVYAVVVEGVPKSPELLEHLNELNAAIRSARLFCCASPSVPRSVSTARASPS